MTAFIHVNCPCGREVRAKSDQVGSAVRCWNCGRDVVVPVRTRPLLSAGFVWSLRDTFRSGVILPLAGWALLAVAALFVPYGGPWLTFALLVVGAWFYQCAIADAGEAAFRPRSVTGLEKTEETEADGRFRLGRRALLSVVAAAALVAPVLIRNGGQVRAENGGGSLIGTFAALSAWLVVPLVLAAANARDRRSPLSTATAARTFCRHPLATAAGLLIFPLGVCVVEATVALLTMEQGAFTISLCYAMPAPTIEVLPDTTVTRSDLVFRFDRTTVRCPYYPQRGEDLLIYLTALAHGHWLVFETPPSLTRDWIRPRFDPSFYQVTELGLLALTVTMSALIVAGIGLVAGIQARCLGVVAALDSAAQPAVIVTPEPAYHAHGDAGGNGTATPAFTPAFAPRIPAYAANSPAFAPTTPAYAATLPAYAPGVAAFAPAAPTIPLAATTALEVAPEIAAALTGPPGAPKILLIDDERAFAHAIGKILVGRGFTVILAADAAEGHRLALSARPDLIVLDLLLPDRHGMDLCRELRADPRVGGIPIIVATFRSGADDEIAGLTHGADDYLAKPYVVDVLIARIQKQLNRVRA